MKSTASTPSTGSTFQFGIKSIIPILSIKFYARES